MRLFILVIIFFVPVSVIAVVGQVHFQKGNPAQLATAPFTLSPNQLTATFIIANATATASAAKTAPTPVVIWTTAPTLNSDELATLQVEILNTLVSEFGFEHPVFEAIAERIVSIQMYEITYSLAQKPVGVDIEQVEFNGAIYLAGQITDIYGNSQLILFRKSENDFTLMDNPMPDGWENSRYVYFEAGDGFRDRNGNNLPDLAIGAYGGGSGCPYFFILEISENGQFLNITPDVPVHACPFQLRDVNRDGILEVFAVANDHPPADCDTCRLRYWYVWNGTQYVDDSEQVEAFYASVLDQIRRQIASHIACYPEDNYREISELSITFFMGQYSFPVELFEGNRTTLHQYLKWQICLKSQCEK